MPLEIKYSIEEMENQLKEISCKIKQKDKEMGFPVLLTPPTPQKKCAQVGPLMNASWSHATPAAFPATR